MSAEDGGLNIAALCSKALSDAPHATLWAINPAPAKVKDHLPSCILEEQPKARGEPYPFLPQELLLCDIGANEALTPSK